MLLVQGVGGIVDKAKDFLEGKPDSDHKVAATGA